MALALWSDINVNPRPVARYQIKDKKFEVFISKELNFIYLNIKISKSLSAVIEIKLDKTIYNFEVAVDWYSILRNDSNRKGRGEACYIRNNKPPGQTHFFEKMIAQF